jgi:uncharacterized protein (TIGR02611 family)
MANAAPPPDEPAAASAQAPASPPKPAADDDKPELVRKLGERKSRHKERSRVYRVGNVVVGVVLILVGIVLSGPGVPGPGFAVILVGLALLALEFDRAERLLGRVIVWADRAKDRTARATRGEKVAAGTLAALAIAAFVAAALLWDIPFLPV